MGLSFVINIVLFLQNLTTECGMYLITIKYPRKAYNRDIIVYYLDIALPEVKLIYFVGDVHVRL